MAPITPYVDPVLKKYGDLIKAANGRIKMVYYGDPVKQAFSTFPCIIISKTETRAQQFSNVEDQHGMAITITVITDIRQQLSTGADDLGITKGISDLYEIVEGREEGTFKLKDSSILNILRTNQLMDSEHNLRTDLSSVTRIDYGRTIRQRQPELWSTEAQIQIIAQFIQNR